MRIVDLKLYHYVTYSLTHCIIQNCKTVAFPKHRTVWCHPHTLLYELLVFSVLEGATQGRKYIRTRRREEPRGKLWSCQR